MARTPRQADARPRTESNAPRCRMVQERLGHALSSGGYPPGSHLPRHKELCERFHVNHRTLAKALANLCEQGQLVQEGCRFRVPRSRGPRLSLRPTIVFVETNPDVPQGDPIGFRDAQFRSELSHQAALWDFRIETLPWSLARNRIDDPTVQGFLVGTWKLDARSGILATLDRSGRRCSVWVESVEFLRLAQQRGWSDTIQCFGLAIDEGPGQLAAAHLLERGLHRAVYISPFHGAPWSRLRLAGLGKALRDAGGEVRAVVDRTRANDWSFLREVRENAMADAPLPRNWANRFGPTWETHSRTIRRFVESLLRDDLLGRSCDRLFEEALRIPDASCWVCCNDQVALLAMDWLEERGLDVPERIAVLGFDDLPGSLERGLSSHQAPVRSMVHGMFRHLAGWRLEGARKGGVHMYTGTIAPRRSTERTVED